MCITPSHLIWLFDISKKRDVRAFFLILTLALEHVVCLGESCFSQVNSAQASFSWPRVDLARLLRRAYSRPFWITSFQFVKVCGIHFLSGKASLVSISAAILLLRSWHIYFLLEFEFRGKSCSWVRAWRRRWHLVSPTLYIIIVYRVNLNKLLQIITKKLRWSNKDNND